MTLDQRTQAKLIKLLTRLDGAHDIEQALRELSQDDEALKMAELRDDALELLNKIAPR